MPTKKYTFLSAVLCAVFLFISGCAFFPQTAEPEQPSLIPRAQGMYQTVSPVAADIRIWETGTITMDIEQYAAVHNGAFSGTMAATYADIGDWVEAGQLLAYVDVYPGFADIEAEYHIAAALHDEARADYQNGRIDLVDWKRAEYDYFIAEHTYQEAWAQARTGYLYAPVSGYIVFPYAQGYRYRVNASVTKNELLFIIADLSSVAFRYSGFASASDFAVGDDMVMTFHLPGGDVDVDAVVSFVSDTEQPYLLLEPAYVPEGLTYHTSITVSHIAVERLGVLTLPRHAVTKRNNKYYIYLLVDGRRMEHQIEIGIQHNNTVEILSGVTTDDLVIV